MSENTFYADLDRINGKGVLITGHGKGLVNKNSNIKGEYISNDMVRLKSINGQLFGYQGYIKKENNELTRDTATIRVKNSHKTVITIYNTLPIPFILYSKINDSLYLVFSDLQDLSDLG